MEIIEFDIEDVILTSNGNGNEDGDDIDDNPYTGGNPIGYDPNEE